MTALQDWITLRPVDQGAIMEMVRRPLRAVLNSSGPVDPKEFKLQQPGIERC